MLSKAKSHTKIISICGVNILRVFYRRRRIEPLCEGTPRFKSQQCFTHESKHVLRCATSA